MIRHSLESDSDIDSLMNDFAMRCFRDVADADYVAARLSYRAGLFTQFSWSGLQACEKYLKAIYLINRVAAHNLNHSLSDSLSLAKKLPFEIELSDSSQKMIDYLDAYGGDRYLVFSYQIYGPKLPQLDKLIWELRRYCRVLNYTIVLDTGEKRSMLQAEIQRVRELEDAPMVASRLVGGLLEKIIDSNENAAREPLLWKNMFFGRVRRKRIKMRTPMQGINSPLTLRPQLLAHLEKYVFIPKYAKEAFLAEEKKRSTPGAFPE